METSAARPPQSGQKVSAGFGRNVGWTFSRKTSESDRMMSALLYGTP